MAVPLTTRVTENCTCGASLRLFGETPEVVEDLVTRWQAAHTGDGHVACSADEARYVRSGKTVPPWMRA